MEFTTREERTKHMAGAHTQPTFSRKFYVSCRTHAHDFGFKFGKFEPFECAVR